MTTLSDAQVGEVGEAARAGEVASGAGEGLEMTLMVVSSIVAIVGIGLAWFIWLQRRELAEKAAHAFPGVHRLLLNTEVPVDELYDVTICAAGIRSCRRRKRLLWRGVDVHIIDGAVNGTASIVDGGSSLLRRVQSGSVRAYAGSLLIGVVAILGYYLWR